MNILLNPGKDAGLFEDVNNVSFEPRREKTCLQEFATR